MARTRIVETPHRIVIESREMTAEPKRDPGSQLFSFDMLGEGARTAADADRYQDLYRQVIEKVGTEVRKEGDDVAASSSISVKLPALHPRFESVKHDRVMDELLPRVKELALLAKK